MGGEGDGPGGRSARRGRRRAAAPGERPHDDAKGRRGWRVEAGAPRHSQEARRTARAPPQGRFSNATEPPCALRDVGGDGKPQPVMGGFCDGCVIRLVPAFPRRSAPAARRGACAGGVVAEEALAAVGERRRRESRALVLHGKDEHRGRAARRAAHRAPHRAARPAARTFFARSLRSRRPAVRILHPRVQPLMFVARTPDRGRRARGRPGLVSRRFRILACEREAHRAACGRMVAGVVHEVECGPFQRHGVAEKRRGLRATDEGLLPHGFEAHASSIGHAPRRLIARVRPRRGVDALPAHARPAAAGRVDDQAHVRVESSGALGCRLGGLARVEGKPLLLA